MFSSTVFKLVLFAFIATLFIVSSTAKQSSDDRGDDAKSAQCTTNTGIDGLPVF